MLRLLTLYGFLLLSLAVTAGNGYRTFGKDCTYLMVKEEFLEPEEALRRLKAGQGQPSRQDLLNFGFHRPAEVWVYWEFPAEQEERNALLEIKNAHLDYVDLYGVREDQLSLLGVAGDWRKVSERSMSHYNPLFGLELPKGQATAYLLRVYKDGSNIQIPLYLWEEDAFRSKNSASYVLRGGLFGILSLCFITGLVLFGFVRDSIFAWYSAYVGLNGLYLVVNLGFGQQYLYPEWPRLNDYFRVYLLVLAMIAFFQFSIVYLKLPQKYPRSARVIRSGIIVLGTLLLLSVVFQSWMKTHFSLIFPVILVVYVGTELVLLVTSFRSALKGEVSGILYFAGYFLVIVGSILLIVREFNLIPDSQFAGNAVWFAYLIEILALLVGMGWDLNKVIQERFRLNEQLLEGEKELLRQFFRGQEEERRRMAGHLHDGIAGNLAAMGFLIGQKDEGNREKAVELLRTTLEEVRNISHELYPPSWQENSWVELVNKLVENLRSSGTEVKFSVLGGDWDELKGDSGLLAYRILQEVLANARKHARAGRIQLSVIKNTGVLEVVVEDDGVGFDPLEKQEGIGLRGIQSRLSKIEGAHAVWHSHPGKGTRFEMRLPLFPESGPVNV